MGRKLWRWREVPGYKNLETNALDSTGFDGGDVIKVSVDTFKEFGYNYTGSPVTDHLTNSDWNAKKDLKPTVLGTFSLPVCNLETFNTFKPVEFFRDLLEDPGESLPPEYGSIL